MKRYRDVLERPLKIAFQHKSGPAITKTTIVQIILHSCCAEKVFLKVFKFRDEFVKRYKDVLERPLKIAFQYNSGPEITKTTIVQKILHSCYAEKVFLKVFKFRDEFVKRYRDVLERPIKIAFQYNSGPAISMTKQNTLNIRTKGRGTYNITQQMAEFVANSKIQTGLCHIFVQHTSASLIICENADPDVRVDLETILGRLAPDGDPGYYHTDEGPDDMSAHIRSILTNMDLTVPVTNGQLGLGTWQGIYLYEHRTRPHQRTITVTIIG